jgi:hypothetical protein
MGFVIPPPMPGIPEAMRSFAQMLRTAGDTLGGRVASIAGAVDALPFHGPAANATA